MNTVLTSICYTSADFTSDEWSITYFYYVKFCRWPVRNKTRLAISVMLRQLFSSSPTHQMKKFPCSVISFRHEQSKWLKQTEWIVLRENLWKAMCFHRPRTSALWTQSHLSAHCSMAANTGFAGPILPIQSYRQFHMWHKHMLLCFLLSPLSLIPLPHTTNSNNLKRLRAPSFFSFSISNSLMDEKWRPCRCGKAAC